MKERHGTWELDLISNELAWSDDQYRIYGYEPNEFSLDSEFFLIKTTHVSDINRINGIINEAMAKHNSYGFNRRIVKKNGALALAKTKADIYRSNGVPTRIVGFTQEVLPGSMDDPDYNCPALFKKIVQDYRKTIYFEILKQVREKDLSEDLCQEVFIKAWHNMFSYDPTKGEIYTWLITIASNQCRDYFRSKQFRFVNNSSGLEKLQQSTLTHEPFNMDGHDLNNMIEQLSTSQKEIVELLYIKGFTHDQVSKIKNIPLGTVKSNCRSAIQRLKQLTSSNKVIGNL